VPELSRFTRRALAGSEALIFVYLREGAITRKENDMLLTLKEQYDPLLVSANLPTKWMWADLRKERKLRNVFDVDIEVLPSAVVVELSKGQLRYAIARHEEQDGDLLPVTSGHMRLLLNGLLGGDLKFATGSLQAWRS
jgi:hypothetical protein